MVPGLQKPAPGSACVGSHGRHCSPAVLFDGLSGTVCGPEVGEGGGRLTEKLTDARCRLYSAAWEAVEARQTYGRDSEQYQVAREKADEARAVYGEIHEKVYGKAEGESG